MVILLQTNTLWLNFKSSLRENCKADICNDFDCKHHHKQQIKKLTPESWLQVPKIVLKLRGQTRSFEIKSF